MKPVKIIEHIPFDDQWYTYGDERWSVARLVQLSRDLEIMDLPMASMYLNFDWHTCKYRELAGDVKAIINADLDYPIILSAEGEIMDGRHRLIKALVEEKETIKAVRFDETPHPCFYNVEADEKNNTSGE